MEIAVSKEKIKWVKISSMLTTYFIYSLLIEDMEKFKMIVILVSGSATMFCLERVKFESFRSKWNDLLWRKFVYFHRIN